jgi:DNA-binding NarL/FixJ family response regulator
MKTVLVVDDHDIVRFGLQILINTSSVCQVVDTQASLKAALAAIERYCPDLLVCDMSMDDSKGLETVRAVVKAQGTRPVLIVSMHDEMIYAEQTLALGVRGYLMKEHAHEHVITAVHTILGGDVWVSAAVNAFLLNRLMKRRRASASPKPRAHVASLSPRELEVLEKIGTGKTTKEIAFQFGLSPRTIDIHRANIKKKLDLKNGVELVAFAVSRM